MRRVRITKLLEVQLVVNVNDDEEISDLAGSVQAILVEDPNHPINPGVVESLESSTVKHSLTVEDLNEADG